MYINIQIIKRRTDGMLVICGVVSDDMIFKAWYLLNSENKVSNDT